MKTGVIGLGAMGAPMARNLHKAGYLETVWNRTAEKSLQLGGELGVGVATTPAELASRCGLVVLSVSADEDVLEMVLALLPGLQAGTVVLDTSTVSRETAVRAAELLQPAGASFLDAPVSGGIEGARKATLAMMIGGDATVIAAVSPVLEAIAGRIAHMGPVGSGQATKAVNQVMIAGIAGAVCEALALSEKLNLPSERLLSIVSAGAAGSWFLEHRGKSMLENSFDVGFKLSLLLKDLLICRELAQDLDISIPTVEAAIKDYRTLVELGDGDHDISGLIRLKRGVDQ